MSNNIRKATLTCPKCHHKQEATIPNNGKQHFFKCANEECQANISIKEDECCVFCVYSDTPCSESTDSNKESSLNSLI